MTYALHGVAATAWWPDEPGAYTQDDVRIEPALGTAVLAGGRGGFAQGKAASKLALWSVLGELAAPGQPVERRLARGLERANLAVRRLSLGWGALVRPWATLALVTLDGADLVVAQLGDCRISRVTPTAVARLTREHTLAIEAPTGAPLQVVTRALGPDATPPAPELVRIPAAIGQRLVLGDAHLHAAVDDDELARLAIGDLAAVEAALAARLRAGAPSGAASFAVVDVIAGPPGPAVGTSTAPAPSWLYWPRADLPPVPPRWDDGASRGPDAAWFDEVYALVMAPPAGC